MIDHMGFGVGDYDAAKKFYTAVLAPLGYTPLMEASAEENPGGHPACGFGSDGKPAFWIGADGRTAPHLHIALTAPTRAAVDAFHAAALAGGATDNGPPGLRPNYHADYYAAFVIDADGHNIEAVSHSPA